MGRSLQTEMEDRTGRERTAACHGSANRLPSAAFETTGTSSRYFEGEVLLYF